MSKFKLGEEVEWSTTPKHSRRGFVEMEVFPANGKNDHRLRDDILEFASDNNATIMFDSRHPRNETSYLVLAPGPTRKSKPRLYWPRVSQLRRVEIKESS